MGLVFLTPLGALVGVAIALPAAAAVHHRRHAARLRRELRLPPASPRSDLPRAIAVTAIVALIAVGAAHPALSRRPVHRIRTDAAVYFAFDVTRSMLASTRLHAPTRLQRAVSEAEKLRDELADFPIGIASLTDNALPSLLPSTDRRDVRLASEQAVLVNSPPPDGQTYPGAPPLGQTRLGTSLAALEDFATADYFPPRTPHRLVILWTDGESAPFAAGRTARLLGAAHIHLLVVHTWRSNERIFRRSGREDPNYRPDPRSNLLLAGLGHAARGGVYGESDLSGVSAAARRVLGRGPTEALREPPELTPLAAYAFAAALLPFAFLLLARRRSASLDPVDRHEPEDYLRPGADLAARPMRRGRLAGPAPAFSHDQPSARLLARQRNR